jgi:Na+/proline symporter
MIADSLILTSVLVAATLPFVASIFSAFSPSTRVRDINGYFLYDRKLNIDGFLKTTIGYSLQVAAITLFFYWTFSGGILGPLIVCVAWTGGYWLLGEALRFGLLDHFLGTSRDGSSLKAETIHGFIGTRVNPNSSLKHWTILAVSMVSVVGLGGTMMAEIDYSTQFFVAATQIVNPTTILILSIQIAALIFTSLYVLWGGYTSAVFTDRFQVPVAYVAFSIFGFAVAATVKGSTASGIGLVVVFMAGLFFFLLLLRRRLLRKVGDTWDQLTAALTFWPILLVAGALLVYLRSTPELWSFSSLSLILFPPNEFFVGFGLWGTIALIFTNGIWQLVDISSLQRLQSLDKEQVDANRENVISTIRTTGVEAGIGWFLITLTAVILKCAGLRLEDFVATLLSAGDHAHAFIIPIFIFTVVVYMLSTISGFISALSYISFYDIVPAFVNGHKKLMPERTQLHAARLTTILVIIAIFVLYLLLRLIVPGEKIAGVLYAIYAFQITILPSALVAIFMERFLVNPLAAIFSVIVGTIVAGVTATHPDAWQIFAGPIGMDQVSWGVIPPLASALAACLTYLVVSVIASPFMRTGKHLQRKQR